MRKSAGFFLCVALSSASIFSGQTGQRPLRHEVRVAVVNVPVYVTDRQGDPVLDLKPEDFVILENGKEQAVTHFALIRNDSPEVVNLLGQFPSARRHFFLLFDLSFTSFKGLLKAREAALQFVTEKLSSFDLVGVGTFSVFQGLKILCPFTADREQAFLAIDTLGLTKVTHRVKDPTGFLFKPYQDLTESGTSPRADGKPGEAEIAEQIQGVLKEMRRIDRETLRGHVSQFIASFQTLALALNVISGRKNLVYFSEGFDTAALAGPSISQADRDMEAITNRELWRIDTELAGSSGLRTGLTEALQRFVGSDCVIHTLDVGGLRSESQVDAISGSPFPSSTTRSGQDTLNLLSHETGGSAFRNTNDLHQPLEAILRATNAHYLLGYIPEKEAGPGKFVNIKVQIKRPGLQLSYRKGFLTDKPYNQYTDLEKQLQLVEYISKDLFSDEVDFQVLAAPYRGAERIAQIPVFFKVPGEQFHAQPASKSARDVKLELYGYAINSAQEYVDYFHQSLSLDLRKLGERFSRAGLKYFDMFLVRPGDNYKIKCIIRNSETGEIGCRIVEVGVPDYAEKYFSLSPPVFLDPDADWILARGYDPAKPSGRKKVKGLPVAYPFILQAQPFIPAVLPTVRAAAPFRVYFRAYNLKLPPDSPSPRVVLNLEAVDSQGASVALNRVELLRGPAPLPPDSHEFLFEGRMENLAPGPYQLKVSCRDLAAGESVSVFVPFVFLD